MGMGFSFLNVHVEVNKIYIVGPFLFSQEKLGSCGIATRHRLNTRSCALSSLVETKTHRGGYSVPPLSRYRFLQFAIMFRSVLLFSAAFSSVSGSTVNSPQAADIGGASAPLAERGLFFPPEPVVSPSPRGEDHESISLPLEEHSKAEDLFARFDDLRTQYHSARRHMEDYQLIDWERARRGHDGDGTIQALKSLRDQATRLIEDEVNKFLVDKKEVLLSASEGPTDAGVHDSKDVESINGLLTSALSDRNYTTFVRLPALKLLRDLVKKTGSGNINSTFFSALQLENVIVDSTFSQKYGDDRYDPNGERSEEETARELMDMILRQGAASESAIRLLKRVLLYITGDAVFSCADPFLHREECCWFDGSDFDDFNRVRALLHAMSIVAGVPCDLLDAALGPVEDDASLNKFPIRTSCERRSPLDAGPRFRLVRGLASHTLHKNSDVQRVARSLVWELPFKRCPDVLRIQSEDHVDGDVEERLPHDDSTGDILDSSTRVGLWIRRLLTEPRERSNSNTAVICGGFSRPNAVQYGALLLLENVPVQGRRAVGISRSHTVSSCS